MEKERSGRGKIGELLRAEIESLQTAYYGKCMQRGHRNGVYCEKFLYRVHQGVSQAVPPQYLHDHTADLSMRAETSSKGKSDFHLQGPIRA